jgi:membrane associated rhomboid family serine protease
MSPADSAAGSRPNPFAFVDLRDAAPAYLGIVAVFAAHAVVRNDVAFALIVCGVIAAVFAGYGYLEAGARGDARKRARERFDAGLSATERRWRQVARMLPVGVGVAVAVVAGNGLFDGSVFAIAAAVGYLLGQVVFALWLTAMRTGGERRG